MIFDQGFLPLPLDTPVPNCKAAVLVLVCPGYFISPVPAISGEHSTIRHRGRRPIEWVQEDVETSYNLLNKINILIRIYNTWNVIHICHHRGWSTVLSIRIIPSLVLAATCCVIVVRCGEMPLRPALHLPSVRDLLALVMSFSLLSLYLTYHLGFSAGRLHTADGNRQEALAYRDSHVDSPFRSPQLLDLLLKVSDRLP